ncbi:hypothetical protein ABZS59_31310 [Streptomyces flaveolus]|uniref:hypothetical protein n=1 Tax=Streptomyces flaveolus TaxID=67297 RepID=UPI0033A3F892
MTEDYASAMVTVIPVIMVVATVEFQALAQRSAQDLPDGRDPSLSVRVKPLWNSLLLTFWAALIFSHTYVELSLIEWLASDERAPDPGLAERVRLVGGLGFVAVTIFTSLTLVIRQGRLVFSDAIALRKLMQQRRGAATTGPAPRAQPPQQRQRPRLTYPAQRAVRGRRRSRARTR